MSKKLEFDKRFEKFQKIIKKQKKFPDSLSKSNEVITGKEDAIDFNWIVIDRFKDVRNDPRNLNLLYSLLNSKNKNSVNYWRALAYFLIIRTPSDNYLTENFNFRQIMGILELVHENNIKKSDDESKSLLEAVKDFISSNAMLTSSTSHVVGSFIPNQYSWEKSNDMYIYGLATYNNRILDGVAIKYKLLLLQVLLEINGITTMVPKFESSGLPLKSDIDLLNELELIKTSDYIREQLPEDDIRLTTLNNAPDKVIDYKKINFIGKDDQKEFIDQLYGTEVNEDWLEYEYHFYIRTLKNDFSAFARSSFPEVLNIDDRKKFTAKPSSYEGLNSITIYEILDRFGVDEDYAEDFHESFSYLDRLLDAHLSAIKVYPSKSLDKKQAALLAGLKNERTISNAISIGEIGRNEDGSMNHDSVIDWLSKDARRRTWKIPIISKMSIEDILEEL